MRIGVIMPGYHVLLEGFLNSLSVEHDVSLLIPSTDVLDDHRSFRFQFYDCVGFRDYPIPLNLLRVLREQRFDLIITGEDFQITSFLAGLYCRLNRSPFILIQEKYFISRFKLLSLIHRTMLRTTCPFIWSQAGRIIVHSTQAKRFMVDRRADGDKIVHLPLGIDTDRFVPRPSIGEDDLRILSVARLTDHKGLPYLIEALSILREKGYRVSLTIVGDGPLYSELKEMVLKRGIDDAVTFIKSVPYLEMPSIYHRADMFVLASVIEVYGMAVLEAKASGLPTVVTDIGGLADLVEDGVDGYIIKEKDSKAIVEAIEKIIEDNRIEVMGQAARQSALNIFAWEKVARKYLDVIEEVSGNHES